MFKLQKPQIIKIINAPFEGNLVFKCILFLLLTYAI